ncbi:MAG: MOSC domain-containing protein [Dehalococcoidia bacterium]|nr:MOSC domain-containing protein [Dehalococcoidia bacterium]
MARIAAVCISEQKGTKKHDVREGVLKEDYGLVGDSHAKDGNHRQLSLLSMTSVEKMRKMGVDVGPGDFAENLTVEGEELVLYELPIGQRLCVGKDIVLEVTQIGKTCHDRCEIFKQVGTCVMPVEGIFTRVIKGGTVKAGDSVSLCDTSTASCCNCRPKP